MPFSFNLVAKCGCLLIFMPFSFDLVANGGCLRFDYHMYGTTINTLNVNVSTVASGTQRLWWRYGSKGNNWLHGAVSLPQLASMRVCFLYPCSKGEMGILFNPSVSFCLSVCNKYFSHFFLRNYFADA